MTLVSGLKGVMRQSEMTLTKSGESPNPPNLSPGPHTTGVNTNIHSGNGSRNVILPKSQK